MEGLQDDTKSRSLESETSERAEPTTTTTNINSSEAEQTQAVRTALAALAVQANNRDKQDTVRGESMSTPQTEMTAKSSCSKSAAEADDDDVFYDARSEDSVTQGNSTGTGTADAVASTLCTSANTISAQCSKVSVTDRPKLAWLNFWTF